MTREVTTYKGLTLIAALYQGRYQGKAWGNKLGCAVAHVFGSSIDDVQANLQRAIDSGETQEKIKQLILERHGEFLRRKGIPADELGSVRLNQVYEKLKRTPHCYECSSSLDNEIDLECSRCGWIVCSCGACGCGHPKYGPQIAARVGKKNVSLSPSGKAEAKNYSGEMKFENFEDAKTVAMQNPGAKLMRHGDDTWVVVLKNS